MGLLDSEKAFREALRDARRIARSLDGLSFGLGLCAMRDVLFQLNMAVWNLSNPERIQKFQRAVFDVVRIVEAKVEAMERVEHLDG